MQIMSDAELFRRDTPTRCDSSPFRGLIKEPRGAFLEGNDRPGRRRLDRMFRSKFFVVYITVV